MKTMLFGLGALVLGANAAAAGGLDRSGQPVTLIFHSGSFLELSFGAAMPQISGTLAGGLDSGAVVPSYISYGFAMKTDLSNRLSLGITVDQPFGAVIDYADPIYPLGGSTANVRSSSVTFLGRYKINNNFFVHGGLREVSASGDVAIAQFGLPVYQATFASATDLGYVIGAAYEKPEIALRMALTYSSATTHPMNTTVSGAPAGATTIELPQSVNLDFQTGISVDTLLFGSVRWADWTATAINTPLYTDNPLLSYANDVVTYSVGLGHRFSDSFSGAVMIGYEKTQGGLTSNLTPTDGYLSIGLGGTYTTGKVKISGGVQYVMLGEATTEGVFADFSGNTALGVGMKLSFEF